MTILAETSSREPQILLRNDLIELGRLAAFARDLGRDAGLDRDQIFVLQLCLEEAVANIIMHGGDGEGAQKQIKVSVAQAAPRLVVALEDDGSPFDPTLVPVLDLPASLEAAPIGGLGVHLIRSLTADMRYERIAGRNRLALTFGTKA